MKVQDEDSESEFLIDVLCTSQNDRTVTVCRECLWWFWSDFDGHFHSISCPCPRSNFEYYSCREFKGLILVKTEVGVQLLDPDNRWSMTSVLTKPKLRFGHACPTKSDLNYVSGGRIWIGHKFLHSKRLFERIVMQNWIRIFKVKTRLTDIDKVCTVLIIWFQRHRNSITYCT